MRLPPAWSSCCGARSARRSRSKLGSPMGYRMIMADPGQIENALLNLAINARDAMPNGGRLIIETAPAEIDRDYAAALCGCRAWPLRHACGNRYRHRHDAGGPAARLRAVLHDQRTRRGQRARLEHGLWLRETVGRTCPALQRTGAWDDRAPFLPETPAMRAPGRSAPPLRSRVPPRARPCSLSRMTSACAGSRSPAEESLATL